MRRKAPRVGDLVSVKEEGLGKLPGLVIKCVGIHLYVRLLASPHPKSSYDHMNFQGHSGLSFVRRDSVDIIARADHAS